MFRSDLSLQHQIVFKRKNRNERIDNVKANIFAKLRDYKREKENIQIGRRGSIHQSNASNLSKIFDETVEKNIS